MSPIDDERRGDGRMSARPADAGRGFAFARRIACDGDRALSAGTPARGGGLREPEAWERRRDPRR
ncbi:MAG TPA: hypothetical protein VEX86_21220 [Longimicrobium sp.]|nr:hypothetical protein [Longimicrobium sp.]